MLNERATEQMNELMISTFNHICEALTKDPSFNGEPKGYLLNFFASCLSKVIISEMQEEKSESVVDYLAEQMKENLRMNYKLKKQREKE